MTTSTIIALDAACIAWVCFVLSDPWERLVSMLRFVGVVASGMLFAFPIVAGMVIALQGGDNVLTGVFWLYVMELIGVLLVAGSFLSIRGIWSLVRGVWFMFAASIAAPCCFVLGSIVWLTW